MHREPEGVLRLEEEKEMFNHEDRAREGVSDKVLREMPVRDGDQRTPPGCAPLVGLPLVLLPQTQERLHYFTPHHPTGKAILELPPTTQTHPSQALPDC